MNYSKIGSIPMKLGLTLCLVMVGCIISRFTTSQGYFEYKYYCETQNNNRITISLKAQSGTNELCLSRIKELNNKIDNYTKQIKIAQTNLANKSEFDDYWQSYIDETQPKLLQSRIFHLQIIKAMGKFEGELFQKTLIYTNYRYKTTYKNLARYVAMRQLAIINATDAGANEDLQKIIKKYTIEKRKFEILNLMLKAKNFNEFMPFYTMLKKGELEY